MANIQHKRGSRTALNALASSGGLSVGQIYLITDENRIAVGLSSSTFEVFSKRNEPQNYGNSQGINGLSPAIAPGQPIVAEQIPDLLPINSALIEAVQSAFPAMAANQALAIAASARTCSFRCNYTPEAIVLLLANPSNTIWDFKNFFGLYQDTAGTTPVTADEQSIRRVRDWADNRNLVFDSGFAAAISNAANGANFPNSIAIGRFSRRADITRAWISASIRYPNTSDSLAFLLGDVTNVDFHSASDGSGNLFYPGVLAQNAILKINGLPANQAEAVVLNQPICLSIYPTTACAADSIGADRSFFNPPYNRTFYGNALLYILSSAIFNALEVDAINKFAMIHSGIKF